MNKPLLHVFVVTWNEEKIILDFIQWYRSRISNCLITVIDNMSTDRTADIALDNECEVRFFNTNNQMDEKTLMDIRNNCWKQSEAQWCLVVDTDELVDVTTDYLTDAWLGNIVRCKGYEMFGTEEDIIETLTQGCESAGYCKPVLFRPNEIEQINLTPGSHDANPKTRAPFLLQWETKYPRNMYHTKWRSWSNGIERARLLAKRRSEHSKQMGWNFHYELDESIHKEYYENGIKNSIKVR